MEQNFFAAVSHAIRLPTKTTGGPIAAKSFGSKVVALALNSNETLLVALTETLQLVCYSFKGKVIFLSRTFITSSVAKMFP